MDEVPSHARDFRLEMVTLQHIIENAYNWKCQKTNEKKGEI